MFPNSQDSGCLLVLSEAAYRLLKHLSLHGSPLHHQSGPLETLFLDAMGCQNHALSVIPSPNYLYVQHERRFQTPLGAALFSGYVPSEHLQMQTLASSVSEHNYLTLCVCTLSFGNPDSKVSASSRDNGRVCEASSLHTCERATVSPSRNILRVSLEHSLNVAAVVAVALFLVVEVVVGCGILDVGVAVVVVDLGVAVETAAAVMRVAGGQFLDPAVH